MEPLKEAITKLRILKSLKPTHWAFSAAFILTIPPLSQIPQKSGLPMVHSTLWNLAFLIVLAFATKLISEKKPKGWVFLSCFFFANSFGTVGIAAWTYIAISIWTLWVWINWSQPQKTGGQ